MRKRILAAVLSMCLVLSLLPTVAFAAEDGAAVTDSNSAVVTATDGIWKVSDGSYTVSGTATDSQSIEITGDVTLEMNNAVLKHTTTNKSKYAPAISVTSGNAKLILTGTNEVEGSAGYAGIYVAEGASLTISGDGSLTAKGGDGSDTIRKSSTRDFADFGFDSSVTSVYFGGGAGIGGNGAWVSGSDVLLNGNAANIGTAAIESGSIEAIGGKANTANAGGGAGIGTGGASTKVSDDLKLSGTVKVNGGTINAIGGDGEKWSLTGGGAGIGSGGATGAFYTAGNEVNVLITDGGVTATGTADGAGIGGGANVDGGIIKISGGTVNATGGYEIDDGEQDGGYGGAGIGGGDNGGVTSIEITGDANVTATAVGAAAGIGSGNNGKIGGGNITISGNAVVTAVGGSYKDRLRDGGAGIGAGRSQDFDSGFDKISILGNARVRAYAGAKAQAIGVGTYYDKDANFKTKIEFSKTANVWMFNQYTTDSEFWDQSAFWGQNTDGTLTDDVTTNGANLIWYTGETPAADTATAVSTKDAGLQWKYNAERKVQILKGEKVTAEEIYAEGYTLGNWAAICEMPKANISYVLGEGAVAPDGVTYDPEEVEADSTITLKPAPTKEGYVFTGWSDGTNTYPAGASVTPAGDMNLTAQWTEVNAWVEDENKLNVSVEINVDMSVSQDQQINAAVSEESKETLKTDIKAVLQQILRGETVDGIAEEDAAEIRTLLNAGAPLTEVKLTIRADLQDAQDEVPEGIAEKMASGEMAQTWNLSVEMDVLGKAAEETLFRLEDAVLISQTASKIDFLLTTGQDLSRKTVRVLYLHNDEVKTAQAQLSNAANGVVTVQADEFSPYVILSRTRSSGGGSSVTTYPITVEKTSNGKLTADRASAAKDVTVTITATPNDGYQLDKLTVVDKNGKQLTVTSKGNGQYSFVMPASAVTISASFAATNWGLDYRDCPKDTTCPIWPFTDARTTDWYHDGVHFCLENKLMVGYGDHIFQPDAGTSRAMITVMLWRLSGSPVVNASLDFEDVQNGSWYTEAIRWAKSEGVVKGYDDSEFGPDDIVTREQMATILWRYAQYRSYDVSVGENTSILSYSDAADIAEYAVSAMQWACGSGMIQGDNGKLHPQGSTTRAQMATMMMRFCAEIIK